MQDVESVVDIDDGSVRLADLGAGVCVRQIEGELFHGGISFCTAVQLDISARCQLGVIGQHGERVVQCHAAVEVHIALLAHQNVLRQRLAVPLQGDVLTVQLDVRLDVAVAARQLGVQVFRCRTLAVHQIGDICVFCQCRLHK